MTMVIVAGVAGPLAAQAQTTTGFDGIYAGVSVKLVGLTADSNLHAQRWCREPARPARLVIENGSAQTKWGAEVARGEVTPQGRVVLRDPLGSRIDAQIDASGTITARGGSQCVYDLVWQKR